MNDMQKAALRRIAKAKVKRDPDDLGPKPDYSDEGLKEEAMKPMPGEYRGETEAARLETAMGKVDSARKGALQAAAKRRAQRRTSR
jgi:hypothetical protein